MTSAFFDDPEGVTPLGRGDENLSSFFVRTAVVVLLPINRYFFSCFVAASGHPSHKCAFSGRMSALGH